jgi:hypothetical protein
MYLLLGPPNALYLQWVCGGLNVLVRRSPTLGSGNFVAPFTHSTPFHPVLAHLNASQNRPQLAPLDSGPIAGATYAREPRQHSAVFLSLVQPFFTGLPATSLVALSRHYLWVSLATLLIQHDSDS